MRKTKLLLLAVLVLAVALALAACVPTGTNPVKYTVTFVDYDDTVIATFEVEEGLGVPTPPADPVREGDEYVSYVFAGWDVAFDNITASITVKATYTTVDKMYMLNVIATEGGTVDLEGGEYRYETEITLTATVDEGYNFINWVEVDGDNEMELGTETTLTITMPAKEYTVKAVFELIPAPTILGYYITPSIKNVGTGIELVTIENMEAIEMFKFKEQGQYIGNKASVAAGFTSIILYDNSYASDVIGTGVCVLWSDGTAEMLTDSDGNNVFIQVPMLAKRTTGRRAYTLDLSTNTLTVVIVDQY
ncbi:MAG: InlB B-repeat-containing protein [Clostridia bacterium]|nr:InlB B-repeat-containing protein [Clostridia bacterium]